MDKQALIELRDKVKAGEWCAGRVMLAFDGVPVAPSRDKTSLFHMAQNAFGGSLDLAMKLHNAVLPENVAWWVETQPNGEHKAGIFIGDKGKWVEVDGSSPARAWLIAILSALIEGE